MTLAAPQAPDRTLGETPVLSCTLCALGVLIASFLCEPTHVTAASVEKSAKASKPAMVQLEPARLRTAASALTHVELPAIPGPDGAPHCGPE